MAYAAALAAEKLQKKHKGKVDSPAYMAALRALRKKFGVTKAELKAQRKEMYASRKAGPALTFKSTRPYLLTERVA